MLERIPISGAEAAVNILSTATTQGAAIRQVQETASHIGTQIMLTLTAAALAFVTVQALVGALHFIGERGARYRAFKKAIPLARVLVWGFTMYAVVHFVFAPTREALWAFLTASGVAIGFASQDILKNIFGGLVIIFDRPFQVGDKIKVGEHYGEVIGIGLRTVRIVTSDDNTVTIPNAEIVSKAVANANSGELNCQVVTEIMLADGADVEAAKTAAWEAAATSRYVYLKKPVAVNAKDAPYENGLRTLLKIKAYVLDPRYEFAFLSDVTLAITAHLRRNEKALGTME